MLYSTNSIIIRFSDNTQIIEDQSLKIKPMKDPDEYLYTVKDGDTLFSLAQEFYLDTSQWFNIAEYNDIGDPIELVTGTILKIPHRVS